MSLFNCLKSPCLNVIRYFDDYVFLENQQDTVKCCIEGNVTDDCLPLCDIHMTRSAIVWGCQFQMPTIVDCRHTGIGIFTSTVKKDNSRKSRRILSTEPYRDKILRMLEYDILLLASYTFIRFQ